MVAVKSAIERIYPHGLDGFAVAQPNYVEDDHLLRVGFMSTAEAADLLKKLQQLDKAALAALIVRPGQIPTWLETGVVEGTTAVWLAGREPGPLVRAIHGFAARGSPAVLDALALLADDGAITVERRSDSVGNEILRVGRRGALVEVQVIRTDDPQRVGLWGARRPDRRAFCRIDIDLIRWLSSELVAVGADLGCQ